KRSDAMLALCAKHGFRRHWAIALTWRGLIMATQGQAAEGIAQIQQGMEAYLATPFLQNVPTFLAMLAQVYAPAVLRSGRICLTSHEQFGR
ncbi:MAG: hypothetical protein V3U60_13210, partial [Gammaproteobacteria bacterium]